MLLIAIVQIERCILALMVTSDIRVIATKLVISNRHRALVQVMNICYSIATSNMRAVAIELAIHDTFLALVQVMEYMLFHGNDRHTSSCL